MASVVTEWEESQHTEVDADEQSNYRLLPDANDSNTSRRIH